MLYDKPAHYSGEILRNGNKYTSEKILTTIVYYSEVDSGPGSKKYK
ncbi:hypothetical protein [Aquimarina macrocephali]|nr:hypothetical protein [Aquimarina macrocephali]